jgi:YtxH-like protein
MNQFLRLLFGAGLLMTEPRQRRRVYARVTDQLDDVADQASRGYKAVADRVEHLYRTVRGEDDRALSGAACFLIGAGIGAGAGLLLAPASGQETRDAIAKKVRGFQHNARGVARKTA